MPLKIQIVITGCQKTVIKLVIANRNSKKRIFGETNMHLLHILLVVAQIGFQYPKQNSWHFRWIQKQQLKNMGVCLEQSVGPYAGPEAFTCF